MFLKYSIYSKNEFIDKVYINKEKSINADI